MSKIQAYLCVVLLAALLTPAAPAQTTQPAEPGEATDSFSLKPESGRESCPANADVTYYLYSDYIFRGINFSEYPGEGREKLNHQLTTNVGFDLGMLAGGDAGSLGTFNFGTFFEWFAAQEIINPNGGAQNVQEIDYILSWSYDIEPIDTSLTLGYTFYVFPNAKPFNTQEWSLGLEHNDAWMWKWLLPDNEDGVLNPSLLFAQDVDEIKGCWAEIGASHGFDVVESLTVTPSVLLAIDHRYLGPATGTNENGSTRLAYITYGLNADYDLSSLVRIPGDPGTWTLSGFMYYQEALGSAKSSGAITDEFYGGMSVGWSF